MLKTSMLVIVAVLSAAVLFVATVRFMNVAQLAFTDFAHPTCAYLKGRCDPGLVEDVKWTGIVLFSSLSAFVLSSLKALFPSL